MFTIYPTIFFHLHTPLDNLSGEWIMETEKEQKKIELIPVGFVLLPYLRPWTSQGLHCHGTLQAPNCKPSSYQQHHYTNITRPDDKIYIYNKSCKI